MRPNYGQQLLRNSNFNNKYGPKIPNRFVIPRGEKLREEVELILNKQSKLSFRERQRVLIYVLSVDIKNKRKSLREA